MGPSIGWTTDFGDKMEISIGAVPLPFANPFGGGGILFPFEDIPGVPKWPPPGGRWVLFWAFLALSEWGSRKCEILTGLAG